MSRDRVMLFASMSRAGFGIIGLTTLPLVYPAMVAHRPIFVVYILLSLVEEALIYKSIGGELRSFCASLLDLGIITWLVHRAGSVGTPLVSLFFFSGIMNALAVSLRVGVSQAVLGSLAYASVVAAETMGLLPYGPDAADWMPHAPPPTSQALMSAVLVAVLMHASTGVVGVLRKALESRERELKAANGQLEELSQRDPLTGLYNRRRMLEELGHQIARVTRGQSLAVLMIDLDGFKRVNDHDGHLRGDQLLTEIGAALLAGCRAADVASRYGGDEFVVLLPDANADAARTAADRLVDAVREVGLKFARDRPVTASVGIALAQKGDNEAALLRRADESAYRAKRGGGNRVELAA